MKLHTLKIKEEYYWEILKGSKTFELRKNDRDYQVGDLILFTDLSGELLNQYSDIQPIFVITYILENVPQYGLKDGYCILGIKRLVTQK